MTPWRIGRGWTAAEREAALAALVARPVSFPLGLDGAAAPDPRWTDESVEWVIGREPPGPPLPDGPFVRARAAVAGYRFADPRLTDGLFDARTPLLGRDILVEIRVLFLRLLVGVRIGAIRDETTADASCFGIRMDTLDGHILHGSEWVLVVKEHRSGVLRLRIDVRWRSAPLPAWWMGFGFLLFGRQVQERWRRLAARRLRVLAMTGQPVRLR